MASSGVTHPSVSVGDLLRLLDSPWLYRIWTYQEIMLSENPVLVCGTMMTPWWRFSMSVLYLRITEQWADKYNLHTGDSTSDLFQSLRVWRALVLDRNDFQVSRRHNSSSSIYATLDLQLYNWFLSDIADAFMVEYVSPWTREVLSLQLFGSVAPFAIAIAVAILAWADEWDYEIPSTTAIVSLILIGVFNNTVYLMSRNMDHTVRRPRRKYLRHNLVTWPEESSAKNIILSAIWTRQCKENKDFNFGTRNLMQALIRANLYPLKYSCSLSEVYKELTVNLIELTRSPELILAALRSQVPDAPSWTVDWPMRTSWRKHQSDFERDNGLFYDLTAAPMPQGSVEFDPEHPNVLRIRAWTLGRVTAVLNFERLEDTNHSGQRSKHLHNLRALLQLVNAELDGNDWESVEMYLHELSTPLFKFLRKNRHMQSDEILSLLQSRGRSFATSIWQRCGLVRAPLYADLFEAYRSFSNTWAAKLDRCIVVVSGARTSGSDISASHWPSNVSIATCHPIFSTSGSSSAMSARESSVPATQFQDCRVRSGDAVLQLSSMQEKAVVRQEGNKMIFVDALEAMGSPTIVKGWTQAYEISEMPLVDIDRYTEIQPTLPPPQPRRQAASSHIPRVLITPLNVANVIIPAIRHQITVNKHSSLLSFVFLFICTMEIGFMLSLKVPKTSMTTCSLQ